MTYRTLDADAILTTCAKLSARIDERFPDSGLSNVARELLELSRESRRRIDDIRKPFWPVRIAAGLALALIVAIAIGVGASATMPATRIELFSLLQFAETAINDVIFLGVAAFFLLTVESRLKRRKALRALHQLRSIAHVIDMHQLTKDPEQLLSTGMTTSSSPERGLSRFELARYLDYCSEMLSIVSKIAALYLQYLDDALVLNAANDIQNLTSGLSSKIWQKIMIVDGVAPSEREPTARS
ncbi:MAG: hypothetical protein E6Q50_12080 [Lysobacter sp.]|jgi:hypothetical protein|nr:MAG: hypothetical protein E6Q50_12080 [Lysobacter sp.]